MPFINLYEYFSKLSIIGLFDSIYSLVKIILLAGISIPPLKQSLFFLMNLERFD